MHISIVTTLKACIALCLIQLPTLFARDLSSAEYLDLVGHTQPKGWRLTPSAVLPESNLGQVDTNGKSLLGSLDAPKFKSFLPGSKRQTTAPWGGRTAANTNPSDAPFTGVIRSYNFTLARSTLAPDGVSKPVMLINGQFPGPTIEANWGDTISVTVTNQLGDEGTALHWHGMLQHATNFNDGVPGVTQCPIAPGQTYTYMFQASSYGTTWYHAHFSAQYTAGLYGAIIIHGPTDNAQYDVDLGPVMLTDYYYPDYYKTVQEVMSTDVTKISPASDNNLINGKGIANCSAVAGSCTPNAGLSTFQFQTGKTHRLRLINAGTEAIQKFSIDNHELTVMAVDFTPVVPYKVTVVTLAIGQRMDVLVTANGKSTDSVYMRSTITLCSKFKQPNALATIYYPDADQSIQPTSTAQVDKTDPCAGAPLTDAVPYFKIAPPSSPEETIELDITVGRNTSGNFLWSVNNSTFRTDYSTPVLPLLMNGTLPTSMPAEWNLLDFGSAKSVRIVVNNKSPVAHPMHIHGYDMYVLAAGGSSPDVKAQSVWDGSITNPNNPVRRDTYLLQPNGYFVFQIESMNAGVWPFHCHIAWHVSGGLYSNILTQTALIPKVAKSSAAHSGLCTSWNAFTASRTVDQIDSGL